MPSLRAIGNEFKVSAVAIHKNLKYLLNKGLIKKVGY
jgi:DNA-binding transcriptional regulator YhcF (GntR family)